MHHYFDYADYSQVLRTRNSAPPRIRSQSMPARLRLAATESENESADHLPSYRTLLFAATMSRELIGPLHGLMGLGLA